jgi:hypothetical protein
MTTFLGIFLILHGLVHSGLAAAPVPNDPASKPGAFFTAENRSWFLRRLGFSPQAIAITGIGLVICATFGLVLAGLGALGVAGLAANWVPLAVSSAAVSLILLAVFWHPWLVVGVVIDIAILALPLAAGKL